MNYTLFWDHAPNIEQALLDKPYLVPGAGWDMHFSSLDELMVELRRRVEMDIPTNYDTHRHVIDAQGK